MSGKKKTKAEEVVELDVDTYREMLEQIENLGREVERLKDQVAWFQKGRK